MKKYILLFACALLLTTTISSCKKDAVKKTLLVTSVGDTINPILFTYDAAGHLSTLSSLGSVSTFSYNGDKVITRVATTGSSVRSIDSFYYDGAGNIFKVSSYDSGFVKTQTTLLTYNSDNTLNYATITSATGAIGEQLFEYTYSNGKLTQRTKSIKTGGVFKMTNRLELLGYDDKQNPLFPIYKKHLIDLQNTFANFWANPYNITIIKSTMYDNSGQVESVISASGVYTYNADGLPVSGTFTENGNISYLRYTYIEQ
jgi:hypothetical protein